MAVLDRPTPPSNWGKSADGDEVMHRQTMDLADQLQRDFHDRNALYADIDATLFQNFPVEIPEAYRKTADRGQEHPGAAHRAERGRRAIRQRARPSSFVPSVSATSTRKTRRAGSASSKRPGSGRSRKPGAS